MEELNKLIKKLEQEYDDKRQLAILQEIARNLINEYEIKIGEFTIEPLLVEAYYYATKDKKFIDCSVHAAGSKTSPTANLARKRQKNHFGELYVHYGTNDGIDLVLSDGEYYLSYLIKNSLINGELAIQSAASKKLCGKCEKHKSNECRGGNECKYYGEKLLKKVADKNRETVCLPRKGTKGVYSYAPLAVLAVEFLNVEKKQSATIYKPIANSLEKGRQWVLAKYAFDKGISMENICEYLKQKGLYNEKISGQYMKEAKAYIDEYK